MDGWHHTSPDHAFSSIRPDASDDIVRDYDVAWLSNELDARQLPLGAAFRPSTPFDPPSMQPEHPFHHPSDTPHHTNNNFNFSAHSNVPVFRQPSYPATELNAHPGPYATGIVNQAFTSPRISQPLRRDNSHQHQQQHDVLGYTHAYTAAIETTRPTNPHDNRGEMGTVPPFVCEWKGCTRQLPFTRQEDLFRHVKCMHICPHSYICDVYGCRKAFNRKDNLQEHRCKVHGELHCSLRR